MHLPFTVLYYYTFLPYGHCSDVHYAMNKTYYSCLVCSTLNVKMHGLVMAYNIVHFQHTGILQLIVRYER